MKDIYLSTATFVWAVLMLATAASWWLGGTGSEAGTNVIQVSSLVLMGIAFFNVRLVIIHFMEVGHAPQSLRLVCELWVAGVCILILLLYSFGDKLAAAGVL